MNPYLQDADVTIYCGHVLDVLRELPDESVHMCCTSPPFYGLRDYGTGSWEGGDPDCDHVAPARGGQGAETITGGLANQGAARDVRYRDTCGKCGATRVDQQIGLEPTPDEWVAALVDVFREVRRVLRRDGTCWVEIGDSYGANTRGSSPPSALPDAVQAWSGAQKTNSVKHPYKQKDLIGGPWLLAFALRADGWYLRSEIIWAKPNPMPESVTDRPTTSHSRVFLLAKSAKYFYDAEAIREPHAETDRPQSEHRRMQRMGRAVATVNGRGQSSKGIDGGTIEASHTMQTNPAGRNRRSVWTIPTEPYPEAHFATWPTKLVEPMILAGTSERGVCPECGTPWERITESELVKSPKHGAGSVVRGRGEGTDVNGWAGEAMPRLNRATTTVGWQPTCKCYFATDAVDRLQPATVLDPFGGSGTTAHVARKHGRRSILIELNPDYCELAAKRLAQQSLLA